jgi:hypothetical protein
MHINVEKLYEIEEVLFYEEMRMWLIIKIFVDTFYSGGKRTLNCELTI